MSPSLSRTFRIRLLALVLSAGVAAPAVHALPAGTPAGTLPAPLAASDSATPAEPDAVSDQTYLQAMERLRRGREYPQATASLQTLVAAYPSEAKYREALGAALVSQTLLETAASDSAEGPNPAASRRFSDGLSQIEAAVRLQPAVPDFSLTLGWAHLANARLGLTPDSEKSRDRALKAFNEAVRLNPQEFTYWQSLGDYYRLLPSIPAPGSNPADIPGPRSAASTDPAVKLSPASSFSTREIDIFNRLSRLYPQSSGFHYLLYTLYSRAGQASSALKELQSALRYNRSNAALYYLLASVYLDQADKAREDGTASQGEERAYDALMQAQNAANFSVQLYRPAYPPILAPTLQTALGDSLMSETLEIYDRLAILSDKILLRGRNSLTDGDPWSAESADLVSLNLGERLSSAAMGAPGEALKRLPELSSGLKIQEGALAALRSLYEQYNAVEKIPWLSSRRAALDQLRQYVSQGVESASVVSVPSDDETPESTKDTKEPRRTPKATADERG
jgi:tetratricopeptide (TPR) repeat protein